MTILRWFLILLIFLINLGSCSHKPVTESNFWRQTGKSRFFIKPDSSNVMQWRIWYKTDFNKFRWQFLGPFSFLVMEIIRDGQQVYFIDHNQKKYWSLDWDSSFRFQNVEFVPKLILEPVLRWLQKPHLKPELLCPAEWRCQVVQHDDRSLQITWKQHSIVWEQDQPSVDYQFNWTAPQIPDWYIKAN